MVFVLSSLFMDGVWPLALFDTIFEWETQYQEQASSREKSRVFWFTKWDHKSSTLNTLVKTLGNQRTTIGYYSSEAEDELKLVIYKCTISPS